MTISPLPIAYAEIRRRFGNPDSYVETLKSKMSEHRVSQAELGRRAGFDPVHMSRWLGVNRSVKPSLETMLILDEAMLQILEELGVAE